MMAESILQIDKKDLQNLTGKLMGDYAVYGPKLKESSRDREREYFVFEKLDESEELRMDYPISILPPVKVFYPNRETLITFKVSDISQTKEVLTKEKKVLLGVHPCDLHAISLMDKIFSRNPKDKYYEARRDDTIIVGLNCKIPCRPKSFCYDKETHDILGTKSPDGKHNVYDIMLTESEGSKYVAQVMTEEGQKFVEKYGTFKPFTGDSDAFFKELANTQSKTFSKKIKKHFSEVHDALKASFDSPYWDEIGDRCVSCGSCNYVCPTCHCFDTYEDMELNLDDGKRVRRWDGCQNREFSEVAGDENFRETSGSRNRHRVFKKEVYQLKNDGISACVGCGRCNNACIASISLIDIYNHVL